MLARQGRGLLAGRLPRRVVGQAFEGATQSFRALLGFALHLWILIALLGGLESALHGADLALVLGGQLLQLTHQLLELTMRLRGLTGWLRAASTAALPSRLDATAAGRAERGLRSPQARGQMPGRELGVHVAMLL